MLITEEMPEEFVAPTDHSDLWLWLALAALLVVVAYYVAVTLWARPRREKTEPPAPAAPPPPPRNARAHHLAELDRIEREVAAGEITARQGHQQISVTVRTYVGEVTQLPADRMTLSDLKRAGAGPLADAVALMYPPSFAPNEEGRAAEVLPEALDRARGLVSQWT